MLSHPTEKDFTHSADWSNKRISQMLAAAERCVTRQGYADTSIREISRRVGVTKSMVHYYFASKNHLMHELLSFASLRHLRRVTQRLRLADGAAARERVGQALSSLWSTVSRQRDYVRLLVEFWSAAAHDPELRQQLQRNHAITRELVAAGIEEVLGERASTLPVPIPVLAALVLAVLHGLALQQLIEPDGIDTDRAFAVFSAALVAAMDPVS